MSKTNSTYADGFELNRYDPQKTEENDDPSYDHDTVVLHGQWGPYQKCINCGKEWSSGHGHGKCEEQP